MTNKFQIDWQLARLNARKEKDVEKKIEIVTFFLEKFPSVDNYNRVVNWLRMTSLAYKKSSQYAQFLARIQTLQAQLYNIIDYGNNFGKHNLCALYELLKDLESRKYNFQFGGKVPKDHIEFVNELKKAIKEKEAHEMQCRC